ncbi:MAG TPA: MFS transporter [Thermomicrobiales bacterium]|nr:MFS transporter [Thermomicrobiales bacterium]
METTERFDAPDAAVGTAPAAPGQARAGERGAARGPRLGFGPVANTLLGYTLVKGLQLTLYNLIFPLYAYSIGYDLAAIGRINAVGAVTVLLASMPLGMLADRLGRGRLFLVSALITPLAMAGVALSRSLPVLLAFIIVQNAVSTVYWSVTSPLLVAAVPAERRVRVFSINSFLIWGVGALGSAIGGYAAALAGRALGVEPNATPALRVALLVCAAITLVGALPLWRIRNVEAPGAGGAGRAKLRLADLHLFGRLLLPDALQAFGAGMIIGFLPLFFALRFGLEAGKLGWIFTLTGALGGAASLLSPLVARRLGDIRAIVALMGSVAACIFLTALSPVLPGAIGAEASRSALRGTIDPIYTPFAMTRVAPHWRGTLGGLYNVTYATGFALGPLLSGWLQVHYGFTPAFAIGAVAYLCAATTMWLFFSRSVAHPE